MVTPEFRCRDGIYKQHPASNMKLLATTVLCLQPPVESGRENTLQGTLLWCHFASIPTEQPLLHGEGQGWHIWQSIFPQSKGKLALPRALVCSLPPPTEREHWQGFVFCTPPPVIHVAAEGDRRGINIASSEPKPLRAYFVLNKIIL